jgi:hypothetical protein
VTRFVTALAVLVVAAVAGLISFGHVEVLALTSGQTLLAARCLPVSIDGLVVASSMVLLDYARRGIPAPVLARVLLGLGVAATLTANAAAGASHGVAGVAVSMWPAVAFIGAAESFLMLLRGSRSQDAPAAEALCSHDPEAPGPIETVSATSPVARRRPSRALPGRGPTSRGMTLPPADVFAEELAAGKVPGIRTVKRRAHCGQDRAKVIRADLAAFIAARVSAPGGTVEA